VFNVQTLVFKTCLLVTYSRNPNCLFRITFLNCVSISALQSGPVVHPKATSNYQFTTEVYGHNM